MHYWIWQTTSQISKKIYFYAKDPFEAKYQFLINKREKVGLNRSKAFIEYSNDKQDVYKNIIIQIKNAKY